VSRQRSSFQRDVLLAAVFGTPWRAVQGLDARWARTVQNVSALVAYGEGEDGHRHLVAVTLGGSESQDSWLELLSPSKSPAAGMTAATSTWPC